MATAANHMASTAARWSPAALAARWRYQSADKRDARLDLLRGGFVVAMLVDHLGGSSWLHPLTGGNRFYISAAEGFVFLSGLVMGIVYAKLIAREGMRAATGRALRRAGTLYGWALALSASFFLASRQAEATWADPAVGFWPFLLNVATLRESMYLADVLMLYVVLVAAAPLALALLVRGRTPWLLGGSAALWGLHQVGLTRPVDALFAGLSWCPPLAWQLVFVVGLTLGYHWRALGARVARGRWGAGLAGLTLAAAGLIALSIWAPESPVAEPVAAFFGKETLAVGRVLTGAVFFPLLFGLATIAWAPLRAALGWLLGPLGQQALLAYGLHLYLALWANATWLSIPGYSVEDTPLNTLMHIVSVLLLWGLVLVIPRLVATGQRLLATERRRPSRWQTGIGLGVLSAMVGSGLALGWARPLGDREVAPLASVRAAAASGVLAALTTDQEGRAGAPVAAAATTGGVPAVGTPIRATARAAAGTPIAARRAAAATPVTTGSAAPDAAPALPRKGTVAVTAIIREESLFSPILDREMAYLVQVPPRYEHETTTRYPVLYMLHGINADRHQWADLGLLGTATTLMRDGALPPMIIVLPEGGDSYWVNHVDGPRWSDYLAEDVVQTIDRRYRTIAAPEGRAIGGLSMGAHGALQVTMTHPGVFGAVGVHSPSLRPAEQALPFFGTGEQFRQRDPIALIEDGWQAGEIALWLDAGDQDWWLDSVMRLHATLEDRGVTHTWSVTPGEHDDHYWAGRAGDYLQFYGLALGRAMAPRAALE